MLESHLSNYLFYLIPIFAVIPFLASLTVFLNVHSEPYLKIFSVFLFINCLQEGFSNYLAYREINNVFLNNLLTVLVVSFYFYLIRETIQNRKAKRVFLYILIAYPLVCF